MKLSVIIPVYNEARTIKEILQRVEKVDIDKQIILVDDGSTDGTAALLKTINMPHVTTVFLPCNRGKGWAIREGIPYCEGDVILIQDADLEYNPEEYPKLMEPIVKKGAKVVYGSRVLGRRFRPASLENFIFYMGATLLTILTNLLYGSKLTDEPTCYKVFRADILKSLSLDCKGFEFCPEVTAKILRQRIEIEEVPISSQPRSVKEGKKIKLKDWFIAVYTLLKYR